MTNTFDAEWIHAMAWRDMYEAAPPAFVEATGLRVLDLGSGVWQFLLPAVPYQMFNRVLGIGVHPSAREALLDTVLTHFTESGSETFALALIPASQPEVLADWLEVRGLRIVDQWALLTRTTESVPDTKTNLTIREVVPEEAILFGETLCLGYETPEAMAVWVAALVGRPGWTTYLAWDGDVPMGVAAVYIQDGLAWFGPAATLPTYRGRGVQSALLARRIADAHTQGCRLLVAETSLDTPEQPNPSYRNMLRAGFTETYRRVNYG